MHLFTYGSLMYRHVWERVVAGTYRMCSGVVHGYVRRRIVGATYPALVRAAPTDTVAGMVYLNLSARDLLVVDAFEEEGTAYIRIEVPVTLENGGTLHAWTYLYRHLADVDHTAWNPEEFERTGLERFLATYCRDHAPHAANDQSLSGG